MALLSLDRHDVLETIRQSNSLHEAFLRVAKLPAVGEYRTATNADRIRSMTDEELAEYLAPCACPPIRFNKNTGDIVCPVNKEPSASDCKSCWLDWLKEEAVSDG